MTIQKIKKSITNEIGKDVKIVFNGSRNKKEYYKGKIVETYNYIFIVKLDTLEKKSFSYSDVLTSTVKVYFNKWYFLLWFFIKKCKKK